jgi:hypothetical protein
MNCTGPLLTFCAGFKRPSSAGRPVLSSDSNSGRGRDLGAAGTHPGQNGSRYPRCSSEPGRPGCARLPRGSELILVTCSGSAALSRPQAPSWRNAEAARLTRSPHGKLKGTCDHHLSLSMSCIFAYRQHQHTSIQNNSGLPQGPADLSPGRLLMRQTACARRSLAGMIGGGTLGREPHLWHEAARLHHAARRGGGVAVCSARAAAACDAYGRVPARRTNRGKTGGRLKTRPPEGIFQ